MADTIKSRLLFECGDDRIPFDQEKASKKVNWLETERDLYSMGSADEQRKTLEQKFKRSVKVYKDGSNGETFHREYVIDDSVLEMVLRRSPPNEFLEKLVQISPIYRVSKIMYDIIDNIPLGDTDWIDVKRCYYNMRKGKDNNGYALTKEEVRQVFLLRHGWREDTLLMLSSRRRPPLRIIEHLLRECPESKSLIDTPLYDWIPMIYAIAYNASPEVVKALTPSEYEDKLTDFEHLTSLDVYDRTPLDWAFLFDASLHSVKAIAKASGFDALNTKYGNGDRVFEYAIKKGASMETIKELVPSGIDFDTVERNIVKSCISNNGGLNSTNEDQGDYESNDMETHYNVSEINFTLLAKAIARKRHLQQVLRQKSCTAIATATIMLDFYACVLLIYSFRDSTEYYLKLDHDQANIPVPFSLSILLATLSFMTLRELGQFYIGGVYWFSSIWNYFDIGTIVCGYCTAYRMLRNNVEGNFGNLVVGTTGLVWMNALFFLRSTFLEFSVFISGMSKIIFDLVPFIGVTLLLLMAFGEMYMAENWAKGRCDNRDEDDTKFCSFGESLTSTFDFFLGGIPLSENSDSKVMTTISVVYGFLVTIVLLNVVIAIVSASWGKVAEQGKEVYWEYRLIFLSEVKSYEQFLCSNSSKPSWCDRLMKTFDKYLDNICWHFWVREYWGNFDSIIDRVTTEEYGGLSWQFRYDYKRAKCRMERARMVAKTCTLLFIFWSVVLVWFIAGLLTAGMFWPIPIRRFIFGKLIIEEKTDLEEIADDIKQVRKSVFPNLSIE